MQSSPDELPASAPLSTKPTLSSLIYSSSSPPRLGIPFGFRLPMTSAAAFIAGMGMGMAHGSAEAGFRYRAENAHRFPTSATGWYLYHRSKNYHVIIGGVKHGFKMGARIGVGAASFFALEELVDLGRRGKRDFISTVLAGLTFAGGYRLWNRLDVYTAARTAKFGLKWSLVYGLTQDALSLAKGNHLAYVDFILGKGRHHEHHEQVGAVE